MMVGIETFTSWMMSCKLPGCGAIYILFSAFLPLSLSEKKSDIKIVRHETGDKLLSLNLD